MTVGFLDGIKCFSLSRVDANKDRSVSAKEMQRWIMEKTEEHFLEAQTENKNSFRAVDPDGDGKPDLAGCHPSEEAPWSHMSPSCVQVM